MTSPDYPPLQQPLDIQQPLPDMPDLSSDALQRQALRSYENRIEQERAEIDTEARSVLALLQLQDWPGGQKVRFFPRKEEGQLHTEDEMYQEMLWPIISSESDPAIALIGMGADGQFYHAYSFTLSLRKRDYEHPIFMHNELPEIDIEDLPALREGLKTLHAKLLSNANPASSSIY